MKVFTYNIDWAKSNTKESVSIKSIADAADLILWQEAKHIIIGHVLNGNWRTHQNISDHAKQGVAVSWKRNAAKRFYTASRRGRGYRLGVLPHGVKMLPRYFNYRDLELPNGRVVRFVSTHRPPQRYRRLWGMFDRSLARFVKASPHPVIVGMDSNERDHSGLVRSTGLKWHGVGIDGFLVDPRIKVTNLQQHPKAQSDHHPISIDI